MEDHQFTLRYTSSTEFCEIECDNQLVFIRTGELNSAGEEEMQVFKQPEEVESFLDQKRAELERSGFTRAAKDTDNYEPAAENDAASYYSREDLDMMAKGTVIEVEIKNAILTGNMEPVHQAILEKYRIETLPPSVTDYIRKSLTIKKLKGPLNIDGLGESFETALSTYRLWGTGPRDDVYPAALLGSCDEGQDFFLSLVSGNVLSINHELVEEYGCEFWDQADEDPSRFRETLERELRLGTIGELTKFQETLSQYESIARVPKRALHKAATECFAVEMDEATLSTLPLMFLE